MLLEFPHVVQTSYYDPQFVLQEYHANGCKNVPKVSLKYPYHLECIDPVHRHIAAFEEIYLQWKENNKDKDDAEFFEFYDALEVDDKEYRLTWLSEEELKRCAALITMRSETEYAVATQELGTLTSGDYIYVYDDGKLYLGQEVVHRFHHTSLLHGQDVDCAGSLFFRDGKIEKITLESGHYRPALINFLPFMQYLLTSGINIKDNKLIYRGLDSKRYSFKISEWLSGASIEVERVRNPRKFYAIFDTDDNISIRDLNPKIDLNSLFAVELRVGENKKISRLKVKEDIEIPWVKMRLINLLHWLKQTGYETESASLQVYFGDKIEKHKVKNWLSIPI